MSPEATSDRLSLARQHLGAGNPAAAVAVADEIDADTDDPAERAWALLVRLAAVIGLEWTHEYAATVDRAHTAVRAFGGVTALASFHALAAFTASAKGSIEQCVTHLVRSTRTLNRLQQPPWEAAVVWHNIAVAYSYIGFHEHATNAASRARDLAGETGLDWRLRLPEVQVRHGLSLDHRGDTDGCIRILRALLSAADRLSRREDGLPDIGAMDIAWIGYAAARLAVLGEPTDVDALGCLAAGSDDAWTVELDHFGRICLAIRAGETERARDMLAEATSAAAVINLAEVPRLRALSHVADGDIEAAWSADRESFAVDAAISDRLRRFVADGVMARLDHEEMRRTVSGCDDHTLVDPVTGLPNREHLRDFIAALADRGDTAALAVVDVHLGQSATGDDTVYQRVADALLRTMRSGDLVARYGGAQFVLVLPGTDLSQLPEIGRRVSAELDKEDWGPVLDAAPRFELDWADLTGARQPDPGTTEAPSRAGRIVAWARESGDR